MIHPASLAKSFFLGTALIFTAPATAAGVNAQIGTGNIRVEFDGMLRSRVIARFDGKEIPLGGFSQSESVVAGGTPVLDFPHTGSKQENVSDRGRGRRLTLTGIASGIQKTVTVTVYDGMPRMAFFQVRYTSKGPGTAHVAAWTSHSYTIDAATG